MVFKQVAEYEGWPCDRTGFVRKRKLSPAHSFTEPGEKLFFASFYHHWLAADPQQRDQRIVPIELVVEPICPFWNARKPMDMGQ